MDQRLAFVMMPDGRALLRVERSRARQPLHLLEVAGLHLNLANDIFTGNRFELAWAGGSRTVAGPGGADAEIDIPGPWACLPGELGVIAVGAPAPFVLATTAGRRRAYETLRVARLYWPLRREPRVYATGEPVLEAAVWLLPGVTPEETARFQAGLHWTEHAAPDGLLVVTFRYFGQSAGLAVNLTDDPRPLPDAARQAFAGLAPASGAWPSMLEPWQGALGLSV